MTIRNLNLTTIDDLGNSVDLENKTLVENGSKKEIFDVHILKKSKFAYSKTETLAKELYPYLDILKATFYGILESNGSVDVELSTIENRVKSFIPYPAMPGTFFTDIDQIKYGDWVCKFARFIVLMMFVENYIIDCTYESSKIEFLDLDISHSEIDLQKFYDTKITDHDNRLTMNVVKVIKYFEILVDFCNAYVKNKNNNDSDNSNNNK